MTYIPGIAPNDPELMGQFTAEEFQKLSDEIQTLLYLLAEKADKPSEDPDDAIPDGTLTWLGEPLTWQGAYLTWGV